MDNPELKKAVETLLFITQEPLALSRIAQLAGAKEEEAASVIEVLRREHEERGSLQVIEIAEGWQLATRRDFAPLVRKLYAEKMTMRLSSAALETLAIIAYKQPLTRAEIEEIRGVEVIAALETLLEKGLVKVAGRKESIGRPLLYGTTTEFLRQFGLRGIADMPPVESFQASLPGEVAAPAGQPSAAAPSVVEPAADEPAQSD
ncbi:MAG: SMC-Scp complex subunit ScpB [Elusimicrobiota bacterium]